MIPIFPNIQSLAENLIESAGKTRSNGVQSSSPIGFAEFLERLTNSPRQTLAIEKNDIFNLNDFSILWPMPDLPEDSARLSMLDSSYQKNPAMFTGDAAAESIPSIEIGLTLSVQDIKNLLRDSGSPARIFVSLPDRRMEENQSELPAPADGGFNKIANDRVVGNGRIPEPAQPIAMYVSSIAEMTADVPGGQQPPRSLVISLDPPDLLDPSVDKNKSAEMTGWLVQEKEWITIGELKKMLISYDAVADLQMTIPLTAELPESIAPMVELSAAVKQFKSARPVAANVLLLDPRKILNCRPDARIPVTIRSYFAQDDYYGEFVKSMEPYYPHSSGARSVPLSRLTFADSSAAASPPVPSPGAVIQTQPDGPVAEDYLRSENSDYRKPASAGKNVPEIPTSTATETVQKDDLNSEPPGDNLQPKMVIPEPHTIARSNGRSDFPVISTMPELTYPDLSGQLKAAMLYYRPGTELSIRIEPEHLGKIKMKISYENGRVEAALKVESDEVRNMLETDLKRLKEYLDIDSLKIDIDSPDRRNPAEQFAWGNPRRSTENRNRSVFSGRPEEPTTAAKKSGAISGPWQTRIDLFA